MKNHLIYQSLRLTNSKNGLKKIAVTFLLFILSNISCIGQDNIKNEKNNSKVKCRTTYSCNAQGKDCFIQEKQYFNPFGNKIKIDEYIFDEVYRSTMFHYNNMNKLDSISVDFINNKTLNSTTTFLYDQKGNLIEERTNAASKEIHLTEYIYNQEGQLVLEIHKTNNQTITEKKFFYDESKNRYKEVEKYFSDGSEDVILKYFDENHKEIKVDFGGDAIENYYYDKNQNLIKVNRCNKLGVIESIEELTYNHGLLETSIVKNTANEVGMFYKFEYDFFD